VADPPFAELDTPALLVERRVLEANVTRMQGVASASDVALRPHVKTHKSVAIARLQLEAGAQGVTVATLTEAEVMVDAGLADIFVAYPPVGVTRLQRLAAILERACVAVGIASRDAVNALSALGARLGRDVHYRWEVDSGLGRLGTRPGESTVDNVLSVLKAPRTVFDGLFTHAGHAYRGHNEEEIRRIGTAEGECLVSTAAMLRDRGISVGVLSAGSTPTAIHASAVDGITEIRPGNYVFNDATQVALGVAAISDCAQTVLATVVGRPAPDRVVIDAGSKALPAENPSGRAIGWGIVLGHPDLRVDRLYEEHGVLLSSGRPPELEPGDRVRIITNHACTASNLHARYWMVDGDEIRAAVPVGARGWTKMGG
jgi:D-serine deaminase-like pyridoxal phosphate-dependent protein